MEDAGRPDLAKNTALMEKIAYIDMVNWQYMQDDVVAWTRFIKTLGFKLGILSNIPTEFLTYFEKNIPPFNDADYACFSCRVKLIKPERAIYENVLSGLGVEKPEEAVFFDDIEENIEAANALGIHGILWTGLQKARADLQALLSKENGVSTGIKAQMSVTVDETNTASSLGSGYLPVFGTPAMIALMEETAASCVELFLESGYSTVGTEVNIKHLAATPIGMQVRIEAELTGVNGRELVFTVAAYDDAEKIGEGTHTRFIVQNEKFLSKTAKKAAAYESSGKYSP
jgi:predicted thioesterase